jgi:hypothetical protein
VSYISNPPKKNGDGCLDIEEFTLLVHSLIDGDFKKADSDKKTD